MHSGDWQKTRGFDKLILCRCDHHPVLQLRTIPARRSFSRPSAGTPDPDWIPVRTLWTYLTALAYAVAGIPLLLGKKTRTAATLIGATLFFIVLVVYVPIAIVDRASLDNGLNYFFDTLMFCGTVLLLAGALPREA